MASGKLLSAAKKRQPVKDYILTAIDQLKQRKARPDRYRIAYVLNKQFGVDFEATKNALEQMTDEHKIVRVDYKGSVSYRDIKNWIRVDDNIQGITMYAGAFILNSDRATVAINQAVRLLTDNPEKTAKTVTLRELEGYFKSHNKFTTAPLSVAIQREVNAGNLAKIGPDAFIVRKFKKHKPKMAPRTKSPTSECVSDGNEGINDNGKRVKKTKVIFDPSESPRLATEPPPPKRPRKVAAASATASRRVCNICRKLEKHEVVLVCDQCHTPAHPSCLGYSRKLAKQVQNLPWTCMDCKTCKLCTTLGGELIFCDKCDEAFHMDCHRPAVRKKPVGEWVCFSCRTGRPLPPRLSKPAWKTPSPVKPATKLEPQKPVKPEPQKPAKPAPTKPAAPAAVAAPSRPSWPQQLMAKPVDTSVPDASEWTASQVAAYFSRHGFGQHAVAFQKHEVDGPALLLMARMDVLRGLGLKLGPALKIYNHVKLLQTRRRACLDFCLL